MTDTGIQLHLEPTFPLDGRTIKRRIRRSMIRRLVPLGVIGVALSVGLSYPLGATGWLLGMICAAVGLDRYFRANYQKIEARVIGNLIREHNLSQDQQLQKVVAGLQERGFHSYASAMGKFLLLKQRIESSLHQQTPAVSPGQNLDNLVDRICSLTCDHLWKLARLDEQVGAALTTGNEELLRGLEQRRVQVLMHVQRAYATMYECLEMVLGCRVSLEPGKEPGAATDLDNFTAMDKAIQQLEEENSALKRVIQRLQTDFSIPPAPNELYAAKEPDGLRDPNSNRPRETAV